MYTITAITQSKKELCLILNACIHFTDDQQVDQAANGIRKIVERLNEDHMFYALAFNYPHCKAEAFKTERAAIIWLVENSIPEGLQSLDATIKINDKKLKKGWFK